MVNTLAVEFIADADLDLLEPVEHIELGQRDAGNARGPDGLAYDDRIEPAAAALAPGDDAIFASLLAQPVADFTEVLGWKRSLPDTGRIGLDDAQHEADRGRPQPGAGGGLPRNRIGRSHEGIGAMVVVEQGALGALEEDTRAGAALLIENISDAIHEGKDRGCDRHQLVVDCLR